VCLFLFRTTLGRNAFLLISRLSEFENGKATILLRLSTLQSLVVFVFFQSVTLNTTSTEANHSNYDANAEDRLSEQNAEFSELYSEQNDDSCEICKKSFSNKNNPSGHIHVSSKEAMSRCEMCVVSLTQKPIEVRRFRSERPLSCNVCKRRVTSSYSLDTHVRVHTGERPFSCEVCKR
jgi:hypothetical protein